MKHWSQEELKFLKDNCKKMSESQLAKQLPTKNVCNVKYKCKALGLVALPGIPDWKSKEIIFLKKHSITMNRDQLLERLPRHKISAIQNKCKKLGLKIKKKKGGSQTYSKNDAFFDEINTQSCFWAGFIANKGCIYRQKHHCDKIALLFSRKNKKDLEFFKEAIEYDGPILDYTHAGCKLSRLWISNAQHLCDKLQENFNITVRKSTTLQPPKLKQQEHIAAFIFGYYFQNFNNHQNYISLQGTLNVVEWTKVHLCGWDEDLNDNKIIKSGSNKTVQWTGSQSKMVRELIKSKVLENV